MKKIDKAKLVQIIHDAQVMRGSDGQLAYAIVNELCDKVDIGNIFKLILDNRDATAKEKEQTLYTGLDSTFDMFADITLLLTENKTSNKAKNAIKLYTETNISGLSYAFKARLPKGTADGDHELGKKVFKAFIKALRAKNRDTKWEENVGLKDYYDLCLKNNPETDE